MAELEDSVVALAARYLDPFIGAGGFDYVTDFGALLPPMVIGEMLGVPEAERDTIRLLSDDMMHIEEGATGPSEQAMTAGAKIYEYYAAMIAERRAAPRDDLVSALLDGEMDEEGSRRRLREGEILWFIMLLNGAGIETVARLLSWAAVTLARNPDQREILVADPSLVPGAIEELLRYEAPSPVNGRWVTRPVPLHGVPLPPEPKLLLLSGSATRPPEGVRRAEPLGWDRELWAELGELRPVALGVRQSRGGDGAGLVELALAGEEAGRRAAPVPLAETAVAARILAATDADGAPGALDRVLAGEVASVAVGPDPAAPGRRIVPAGAVATVVLGLRGETLVMCSRDEAPTARNLPCAPLACWHLPDGVVLASGDHARSLLARAQREWRASAPAPRAVGVACA